MQFDVLKSMSELEATVRHYDSSVFPDDSAWYCRFENYVSTESDRRCIGYACSGDGVDEVLIPLQLTGNLSTLSALESLDNYYSVDFRPICTTLVAQNLIRPLLEKLLKCEAPDLFWLRAIDIEAPEIEIIIRTLKDQAWSVYLSAHHVNWVHKLEGSYEDYLASRSGRVRNTLKRKTIKLMALSGVTFTVHHGQNDLEEILNAYHEIYSKSWKVPEPHVEFVPELIRATAERGQLRLGILRINSKPVAAHFWIVKQQIAFIYKLAHDKSYDSYSPGTVLLGQMIKHTMENDRVCQLDFLSGNDPYKRDWMSERNEKMQIRAYNPRSPLAQFVRYRDEHIKPFLKQFKLGAHKGKVGVVNS